MPATLVVLKIRLAEAEEAQHKFALGQSVVSLRDQNGETVEYRSANADKLASYIRILEARIDALEGTARCSGPLRPLF